MVDIHSHVLPGIDDGARTLEEGVEMGRSWEWTKFEDAQGS